METSTWILPVLMASGVLALFWIAHKRSEKKEKSLAPGTFLSDVSEMAENGKLEPFTGREKEVERTIHVIMRRSKNNPLLIGNPGVGKTAIVHGLATRIAAHDVPAPLREKRVLALDLPGLMAGSQYRGELEKRLKEVLSHLENDPRRYILFIDEVHMLEQASGSEGSLNITDIIKPALARGELQIIGATTWDEYEKHIRPDAALDRRFQPVLVDEPSEETAIAMLETLKGTYEEFHKVKISTEAIQAAVKKSDEFIKNRYLPDKAIDLIDEAAAKVSIECATHENARALGVIHAAAQDCATPTVTPTDIQAIIDQWIIHSKEEESRDARHK